MATPAERARRRCGVWDPQARAVHVVLVGEWPGEARTAALLGRLLRAAPGGDRFHVAQAAGQMAGAVQEAVALSVSQGTRDGSGTLRASPEAVDAAVARLWEQQLAHPRAEARQAGLNIFLLLPGAKAAQRYAYAEQPGACPAGSWLGKAGKELYMWVDAGAGPLAFGPSGEWTAGAVVEDTSLWAWHPGQPQAALAARAAATVLGAVDRVLSPPAAAVPMPFWKLLEVVVVRIHSAAARGAPPLSGIEEGLLRQELRRVALEGQEVRLTAHDLPLGQCDACTAALSMSLRRRRGEDGRLEAALDSAQLLPWFRHSVSDILGDVGLMEGRSGEGGDTGSRRRITAFVFDLQDHPGLLLDGKRQSMAAGDIVVAVRTQGAPLDTGEACLGQPVALQPADITRPLLGGVLQAGWGLSQGVGDGTQGESGPPDFTFATLPTPFGNLSKSRRLNAAQVHAAQSNVLVSRAEEICLSAVKMVGNWEPYDGASRGAGLAVPRAPRSAFMLHTEVLLNSMEQGSQAFGLGDLEASHRHIAAAHRELALVTELAAAAAERGQHVARFTCYTDSYGALWNFGACFVLMVCLPAMLMLLPISPQRKAAPLMKRAV